jgi:hypothetical protein
MQAEVSLEFIESPVNEKPNFGDDRVGDMTTNVNFADIADHDIVLADGTAVNQELRLAINAANGGNKAQKDALPGVEKKWNKYWKKVARYVTEKASAKDTIEEQINLINSSGFGYNKVTRTEGETPGATTNFSISPVSNVSGRAKIKSDSLGFGMNYISIFHTDSNLLDQISYVNNQLTLPPTEKPFVIHTTTDSRETEVQLTSGEKWHGIRFGTNRKGRGPNSNKASVIPQ